MRNTWRMLFTLSALLLLCVNAHAKSHYNSWGLEAVNHSVTTLAWSNPKQILLYRSTGCADACWEARLYDAKGVTKKLARGTPLLVVHCECASETDCSLITEPPTPPQSCVMGDDKFSRLSAITADIWSKLHHTNTK